MANMKYIFSSAASGRPYNRGRVKGSRVKDNACVVMDGTHVVFASETERFSKLKHDYARPLAALDAFRATSECTDVAKFEGFDEHFSHHENHIFECFYQSGFLEAAVLVNDGYGTDDDCITLAYMKENSDPVILEKFAKSDSPCGAYSTASRLIFGKKRCEGKFMGLSAYGKNNGRSYILWDGSEHIISVDYSQLEADLAGFSGEDVMQVKDVAFTLQDNFEETLVEVVKHFKNLLDENNIQTKNLCMSGGGILNCPTNSRIVDLGFFENYFASPQPSDGCAESIGRYFHAMQNAGNSLQAQRLDSAYLGATYSAQDLIYRKERMQQPISRLEEHLQNGGIIAWCQGGAEYGPRALGHRSFLADPACAEMLEVLNRIKGREQWRPLAPIVPEELFSRVFDAENADMCEFMLRTLTIPEKWRLRLQAVCHIDGTTRPQLLRKEVNPQLYALLMNHFEETGVPCLVNTSLNINGFPIVETPVDFCDLIEEVDLTNATPTVKGVFVENNDVYEVIPSYNLEGAINGN